MPAPHLPRDDIWTITFILNEYTPAEVEQMTGLTTASQRDWRRRNFLPHHEKHARFDIFGVAELYVMKMYADQGKSPKAAYVHASRIAAALVKTALMWRPEVWGATDPASIFDCLPTGSRRATWQERSYIDQGEAPKPHDSPDDAIWKTEWVVDTLLAALGTGLRERVRHATQAIWWPNDQVEIGDYRGENYHHVSDGILDRVDLRFDGAASVINLEGAASNLVRRSRLPLLSAVLELNDVAVPNRPELWRDHGKVRVQRSRLTNTMPGAKNA